MPALLPSAAAVTVAALKSSTDLNAVTGGRVGTRLNATLPAVRVQRVAGTSPDPWQDQPVMQLDCWGAKEEDADLLARTLVAVLPTLHGTFANGKLWSYEIESGPFWSPDDPTLSSNARYILTVRLLTTQ
jgi:hypothetical protein